MQHVVKDCLHYYPACNLQRNTHIAPSKNTMERGGLAKPCGLEFTPAYSMKCAIAEKSSRSLADYFDLPFLPLCTSGCSICHANRVDHSMSWLNSTRDIDLLGRVSNDLDLVRGAIEAISPR